MTDFSSSIDIILDDLLERSKELNAIYKVEEILGRTDIDFSDIFRQIIAILPSGWQYPEICQARIIFQGDEYRPKDFKETSICLSSPICIEDREVGLVEVYYTRNIPHNKEDYFLKEEKKLIDTIADRIGETVLYRRLKQKAEEWENAKKQLSISEKREWRVILELLEKTDQKLFFFIARKMVYHLFWQGIQEAKEILTGLVEDRKTDGENVSEDINRPSQKQSLEKLVDLSRKTFRVASEYLSDDEIFLRLQKWIQEDKASFLSKVLTNSDTPLAEVIDAVTRHRFLTSGNEESPVPVGKGTRVSLIRRFLSDHLDFINIAKNYIDIQDFYHISDRIIFPTGSYGHLGGKSSGLILADRILKNEISDPDLLSNLRTPKTWYITTDALGSFILYNNLEEINEQKYKDSDQIRLEYPNIIQLFKNSMFPAEIVKGLNMALDDLGDSPLIVRSSSLLEDRMGTAFSGKYKSLFLANQGGKEERLSALMDAVAEVYASVFSPDPIQYRAEHGLTDFNEEMGIMIQQVVGIRIGDYFFPPYAGVAFSSNEFRWSTRIKREDGLVRLVLGLGTRAVDRMADDYPVLISPGRPSLRANITPDEIKRYSPKKIDLINLKTNTFETRDITSLLRETGEQFPLLHQYISLIEDHHVFQPTGFDIDVKKNEMVVTFEGLISRTPFIQQIHQILKVLQEKTSAPVDIEFASDGKLLYLLQCRPQSSNLENVSSPIPHNIPDEHIVFNARKYISNGRIPDSTHIVYIDPENYSLLPAANDMLEVGKAVSRLNKLLPKRQFILMGPGRWGSRGDIKLGVSVTYSDFNNTSALIEIARKKGNYVPELSFGTHFFQDLVEASIRYIPLYPDDDDIVFNESFLSGSENILPKLIPEMAHLAGVVRVIDVPKSASGRVLRILMNADLGEALGFLVQAGSPIIESRESIQEASGFISEDHWHWRLYMAEAMAANLDGEEFGVKDIYVFGSVKNATAGPGSDIDIIVHFQGTPEQKYRLDHWFSGWSQCLSEMNYFRTGTRSDGLLDIHYVTDEEIENKSSFAVKIDAVTDAARRLDMKNKKKD